MRAHRIGARNCSYSASLAPNRPFVGSPRKTSRADLSSYSRYDSTVALYLSRSIARGRALILSSTESCVKYGDVYSSVPKGVGSRGKSPSTGASTSFPFGE